MADVVLIVLLAITLIHVYRLHRRLGELRGDRAAFEKLIGDFSQSTQQATLGMAAMRQAAESAGKELQDRIAHGQQVMAENRKASDDLKMLIGRATTAADQLEAAIGRTRPVVAMRPEPKPIATTTAPGSAAQAKLAPEAEAVLSALTGIR